MLAATALNLAGWTMVGWSGPRIMITLRLSVNCGVGWRVHRPR
jgi:hypothetical protein